MHYCHLSDEQIKNMSLPKIVILLERVNKHIKFEVDLKLAAMGVSTKDDAVESEATEEDVNELTKLFGLFG